MGFLPNYQEYYGLHYNHFKYTWGGVDYNKILVKTDSVEPDDVLDGMAMSTSTEDTTVYFIIPSSYKYRYYLDGWCEGYWTFENWDEAIGTYLTDYTITLESVDDAGNVEALGNYVASSIDQDVDAGYEVCFPFKFDLNRVLVDEGSKLRLKIYYYSTATDNCGIIFYKSPVYGHTLSISIPYAPESGI